MFDFHLLLALFSIVIAWKWGDWHNWKLYYPTIMYMILGDLTYLILAKNNPLWEYESNVLSHDSVELLNAFVVFPCICLVIIPLYLRVSKSKRIAYLLCCAFLYTIEEWLSFKLGYFSYHNGWNLYWSFAFDCIMFPLLILHFKKPLWVWPLSITLAFLIIYLFHLPFTLLKY